MALYKICLHKIHHMRFFSIASDNVTLASNISGSIPYDASITRFNIAPYNFKNKDELYDNKNHDTAINNTLSQNKYNNCTRAFKSLLHNPIMPHDIHTMSYYLSEGVDPNIKIGFIPILSLHIYNYEVVSELLKYKADANASELSTGKTPLFEACLLEADDNDTYNIMQTLMDHGADPNAFINGHKSQTHITHFMYMSSCLKFEPTSLMLKYNNNSSLATTTTTINHKVYNSLDLVCHRLVDDVHSSCLDMISLLIESGGNVVHFNYNEDIDIVAKNMDKKSKKSCDLNYLKEGIKILNKNNVQIRTLQ